MKFCSKCGAQVEANALNCPICGHVTQQYQSPPNPMIYGQQPPYIQQPYYPPPAPAVPGKGMAIAAMVLGIVGLCLMGYGFVLSIVGICLAASSNKQRSSLGLPPLGMAKAGLITGIIGIGLTAILVILVIAAVFMVGELTPWVLYPNGGGYNDGYITVFYNEAARVIELVN